MDIDLPPNTHLHRHSHGHVTYQMVTDEAIKRCQNVNRHKEMGRATCGQCEAAAKLAWYFVMLVDAEESK